MRPSDIFAELGAVLDEECLYEHLGKIKACVDFLVQQGIVEKTKLQNSVLNERQKLVDKYGFPEYNVPLVSHETPVSHWAQ